MKKAWEWAWERMKIGAVPYAILVIPYMLICWIWGAMVKYGHVFFRNEWLDVPLNVIVISAVLILTGWLLLRPWFQSIVKRHLVRVPRIGTLLYISLVPKEDIELVEVQTYDGNWEYALLLRTWPDEGKRWHRVHTLGFGSGKLYSRAEEKNIRRIPPEKQRSAWVTIFSFGLLTEEDINKSA